MATSKFPSIFAKILSLGLMLLLSACSTTISKQRTPAQATSPKLQTSFISLPYGDKELNVRVGIQDPEVPIIGDVLYIHGFADRLDNHAPLFKAWNRAGLRVIAFDLPSHGGDSGTANDLNDFGFQDLANLAAKVEQSTKPNVNRPLILSGWSTGGLVVVRLLQKNWTSGFSRPISGAILFAPGVSIRKFPWTFGNRLGVVTTKTLTHDPNPPHVADALPKSPFWSKMSGGFAEDLMLNAGLSQHETYPSAVRTLVFTSGDKEDRYAKAWVVRDWTLDKTNVMTVSCPHARHEMDNELPAYGSLEVQNTAAEFAKDVSENLASPISTGKSFGEVCEEVHSPVN